MLSNKRILLHSSICVVAFALAVGCSREGSSTGKDDDKVSKHEKRREKKEKKEKENPEQGSAAMETNATTTAGRFASPDCDSSLWTRVYDPGRLQQIESCVSVKGTIEESAGDDDGDQHFLIKLDPGQEELINKANTKKKKGDLVGEIVCANPVTLSKAKSACAGFRNKLHIPAVGEHLTITGSYVIDSHNGWAEVHPVSRVTQISPGST